MKKTIFIIFTLVASTVIAQSKKSPSFEEVISLSSVSSATISPNGKHVVYQMQTVNWEDNSFHRELWLSKNGAQPFQLTNHPKNSSSSSNWSPDGKWIAFLTNRDGNTQIHAIRLAGGESFQVTNTKGNIIAFDWAPDGKSIAFLQSEDKKKEEKTRKDKFGGFSVEDKELYYTQLWTVPFKVNYLNEVALPDQLKDSIYKIKRKAQLLIEDKSFSINDFAWSPDGKKIAFEHQPDPLRNSFFKADISVYDLAQKSHTILINNLSYDGLVDWSPDGSSILYQTSLNDSISNYYKNSKLFKVNLDGNNNVQLAKKFDENINGLHWTPKGIFGIAWQKTVRQMVRIDANTGSVKKLEIGPNRIWNISFSKDGQKMAYTGVNDDDLSEIYHAPFPVDQATVLTNSSKQIKNWMVSNSEVISWKSKDGARIEGVLHKPENYNPSKKYPLLVVIHGGPTGTSVPAPAPSYVYPILQWLNKGALVLMPNYRGSAGYGEKFRSLNVKNLGVGDAWDVESGVQYLENKGLIDGNKVGSMGWSQGGYISAFLTTNSKMFKAISVGAGISNWMTYYVNTDIHPFTRQYLKATPWSNKEIYEKTSPMTNITQAETPTLIQHGEFDRRVPTPNAYELYQGLQDNGVETKLIIYKGFGHGITKPKERLAAVWHNWQWFGKYIWNEEIKIPKK